MVRYVDVTIRDQTILGSSELPSMASRRNHGPSSYATYCYESSKYLTSQAKIAVQNGDRYGGDHHKPLANQRADCHTYVNSGPKSYANSVAGGEISWRLATVN